MICVTVGVLRQLQTCFPWINTLGNFDPLLKKYNIQVPDSKRRRYLSCNALSKCGHSCSLRFKTVEYAYAVLFPFQVCSRPSSAYEFTLSFIKVK